MIKTFKNPVILLILCLIISITALAGAFTAEYMFDLKPCILCLYQRIPFAIIIFFSLVGLMGYVGQYIASTMLGINSALFFGNAVIATYHSGVERKWWDSFLQGCAVPDLGTDPDKILENILKRPAVPCDEIPWADPYFGLSMANYNAILCAGLFALCVVSLRLNKDG